MGNIRIGTRASALALWQANYIKKMLNTVYPDHEIEIKNIKTLGDTISDLPLGQIGGDGIFVKQIEIALLNGEIDIAVHSMKDLPTILPDGLAIGAIPERANPADVLISRQNLSFDKLPNGAKVGTSSLRRHSQLLHARRDINIREMRGNVDTRLKKLESENLDAIVLAYAGVERLGYANLITQQLPYNLCLPAVGQGALCIEIRKNDEELSDVVKHLNHPESSASVRAERSFLNKLGGGCRVPIAALGSIVDGELKLMGLVSDRDGHRIIRSDISGSAENAEIIGEELAKKLIDMGAESILK
jgi:hydroxymethylbilane synthase